MITGRKTFFPPRAVFFFLFHGLFGLLALILRRWSADHALLAPQALMNETRLALSLFFLVGLASFILGILRRLSFQALGQLAWYAALFLGVWITTGMIAGSVLGSVFAAVLMICPIVSSRPIVHAIFLGFGLVGVAFFVAPFLTPLSIGLLYTSSILYDILIVDRPTRFSFMVQTLPRRTVISGLLLPNVWQDVWQTSQIDDQWQRRAFAPGDLVWPFIILVQLVLRQSPLAILTLSAVLIACLSIGCYPEQAARRCLPWIAAGAMVPWLMSCLAGKIL